MTDLALAQSLDSGDADPLRDFHWTSQGQADMARLAGEAEVYARCGNKAGKTTGAAALFVALCRGLRDLYGVRLPYYPTPGVHWVLTKSYEQQVDSSQKAYMRWIGRHPHEVAWLNKSKHQMAAIWVATTICRHATGTHCATCSRIVFHSEQGGEESTLGALIDSAHGDEPPNERVWREVRTRKDAGKRLVLVITATPLYRKDWEWMVRDFADCYRTPRDGRVELRWTMYDNRALTAADHAEYLRLWAGDPLLEARINGDYLDVSGDCPFPYEHLNRWESGCVEPKVVPIRIAGTMGTDSRLVKRTLGVQVWWAPEDGETYFGVIDPALGIADGLHDPTGLHVYARRTPRLVARFDDFLSPYGTGVLAARVFRRYAGCIGDCEMNDGRGDMVLQAAREHGFHRWNREEVRRRDGKVGKRDGWVTNDVNRGQMIAAVHRMLETDSVVVKSRGVVSTLRGVIVDRNGKVLAADGRHDEDMILMGRAGMLYAMHPDVPMPETQETGLGAALRHELGRDVFRDEDEDEGGSRWR